MLKWMFFLESSVDNGWLDSSDYIVSLSRIVIRMRIIAFYIDTIEMFRVESTSRRRTSSNDGSQWSGGLIDSCRDGLHWCNISWHIHIVGVRYIVWVGN